MFNEQAEASMEIKQTPIDGEEAVFENPYVEEEKKEQGPHTATLDLSDQHVMPEPVILYRGKEGIQRWLDEEKVGQLLAQTKNVLYDDMFKQKYAEEIKEYFERQPEGKEVRSVFEILEPGDSVNHQTVVSSSDDRGLELDYFGKKTTLVNEMEIFSVLIKEEMDEWKKQIASVDVNDLFSKDDDDLTVLYRALELLCMQINMEEAEGLYIASDDRTSVMLAAVMAMSLKKPIYVEDSGKKVISISADYSNKNNNDLGSNTRLYHVSLTNKDNLDIGEKDSVIIC